MGRLSRKRVRRSPTATEAGAPSSSPTTPTTALPPVFAYPNQLDRQDLARRLKSARRRNDQAAAALASTVKDARLSGLSWHQIGLALGMTGEGARRRYG